MEPISADITDPEIQIFDYPNVLGLWCVCVFLVFVYDEKKRSRVRPRRSDLILET